VLLPRSEWGLVTQPWECSHFLSERETSNAMRVKEGNFFFLTQFWQWQLDRTVKQLYCTTCHGLIGLYLQLILSNTRQPPSHTDQLYPAKQSNTVTATFFNFQISWEFLSHSSSDVANDMAWGASFPTRENIKKTPNFTQFNNKQHKKIIYLFIIIIY
jgi:hypothetical protein